MFQMIEEREGKTFWFGAAVGLIPWLLVLAARLSTHNYFVSGVFVNCPPNRFGSEYPTPPCASSIFLTTSLFVGIPTVIVCGLLALAFKLIANSEGRIRVLRGFLCAPIASTIVGLALIGFYKDSMLLTWGLVVGSCMSFGIMVIMIPIVWTMNRFGFRSWWHFVIVAAAVPAVGLIAWEFPMFLFNLNHNGSLIAWKGLLMAFTNGAIPGGVGGFVYWFISERDLKHNKALAADATRVCGAKAWRG